MRRIFDILSTGVLEEKYVRRTVYRTDAQWTAIRGVTISYSGWSDVGVRGDGFHQLGPRSPIHAGCLLGGHVLRAYSEFSPHSFIRFVRCVANWTALGGGGVPVSL
ncbi:hypothetical protein D9M70_411380 [compost metagenome]